MAHAQWGSSLSLPSRGAWKEREGHLVDLWPNSCRHSCSTEVYPHPSLRHAPIYVSYTSPVHLLYVSCTSPIRLLYVSYMSQHLPPALSSSSSSSPSGHLFSEVRISRHLSRAETKPCYVKSLKGNTFNAVIRAAVCVFRSKKEGLLWGLVVAWISP